MILSECSVTHQPWRLNESDRLPLPTLKLGEKKG